MQVLYLFLLMLAVLTACQSLPRPYDVPKSLPPAGSIIELHKTLSVKPGSTRVYIQNGKPQDYSNVDIYQPWCQFFLYEHPKVLKNERIIQSDRFSVVESYNWIETFIAELSVVASAGWIVTDASSDDAGPRTLQSIMKLKSENQPQVVELKCVIFDDPADFNYLSVKQMQQTLSELVTIHMNQDRFSSLQKSTY